MLADRVWADDQPVVTPGKCSLEILQSLEWKSFEAPTEAFLNETGPDAGCTPLGADGDVDIDIYSRTEPNRISAIAQCKAWSHPVDVKHVRELYGVMSAKDVNKGYFITSSSFTGDALTFGEADGISLIGGKKLLQIISALSPEKSDKPLQLAVEGDYTTPTCPACGWKLVSRTAQDQVINFGAAAATHAVKVSSI